MPGPKLPPRQTRAAKGKKSSKSAGEQGTVTREAEGLPLQVLSAADTAILPADLPSVLYLSYI